VSQQAPYSYITLAQARQQLANRLFDPSQVFWSPAELTAYLTEALQTWNALTGNWRGDFLFPSQQGVTWYDLTQQPNTLRPYTVTDAVIYQLMCYHLLEPPTGPVSQQLTSGDLVSAVQRRRDEVLAYTACTQTRILVPAVAGRITLPDQVIDVRRMAYVPTQAFDPGLGYGSGRYGFGLYGESQVPYVQLPGPTVVWPEDTWAEQAFAPLFPILPAGTPVTPLTYLMTTQPPLSFDTDAPPSFAGSYELLTVQAGPALSFTAPQTLNVPDDWTHVIKWGALADLFNRESNAKDPLRAAYCEQRYRMGLALLSDAPALLAMRINDFATQISAVRSADLYDAFWQTTVQNQPTKVRHSGLNLLALAPVPDAGINGVPYSMTATVVENAPIPAGDGAYVQIARSDLDALLDYGVHLAALKMGGAEFTATMPLLQRFLQQAALYNRKLTEVAEYKTTMYHVSQREKQVNPVETPEPAATGAD
jgi:hypothetical protein